MISGMTMNRIKNSFRMKYCMQSAPARLPHRVRNWGGSSPTAVLLPRVPYSTPSGSTVNRSGRKATVNSTRRFLKTSAHSLSMMVRMRWKFMRLPYL